MSVAPSPPDRSVPATRPTGVLVASLGLGLIALAGLGIGPLLAAFAPVSRDFLGGPLGETAAVIQTIVGAAVFVYAIACAVAAYGLWRLRTWAWPTAMLLAVVGQVGVVIALVQTGSPVPLALAAIVFAIVIAGLLPAGVRAAFHV